MLRLKTCQIGSILAVYVYRPQRSCGQGNVFTGVCLSTGGRVSASVHAGMPAPPGPGRHTPQTRQTPRDQAGPPTQADPQGPGRHPPRTRPDTLRDQADPPSGSRLQHTVYERPVRILLECILVFINFVIPSIALHVTIVSHSEKFHLSFFYRPQTKFGGKVIFSVASVILSRGVLCMMSLPVWLPGLMFLLEGSLSLVPCSFGGVSVRGVLLRALYQNQKSGQYASYWNAFCLNLKMVFRNMLFFYFHLGLLACINGKVLTPKRKVHR